MFQSEKGALKYSHTQMRCSAYGILNRKYLRNNYGYYTNGSQN